MTRALPPLNWLRTFEAAARHRNFTLAADELGMTQSAVSQQIKSLETYLKTPLFLRSKSRLELTTQAREILPRVSSALSQMHSVFGDISPREQHQNLSILISNSLLQFVVAPRLASFQASYPSVNLQFFGNVWQDERIDHVCDLEIRYSEANQSSPNARPLCSDKLVIVGDEDGVLEWEEIMSEARIETIGSAQLWSDFAQFHDLEMPPKPSLRTDHYGMALNLAQNGLGLSLVSALVAAQALQSGQVFQKYPKTLPAKGGYFITRKGNTNPNIEHFENWLIQQCNNLMGSFE